MQVLGAALDDWVDEGLIYSICLVAARDRAEDPQKVDAHSVRATAVDVAESALVHGLLVAGDLDSAGFQPWDTQGADAARVVTDRWLFADEPVVEIGSVAWFDITDEGERFVHQSMEGSPG